LKANVPVNFALEEILMVAPRTVGVLLYSEFEDYVLAVAKSEQRQLWAKHVVVELAGRICKLDGLASLDLASATGVQAAAVLWISQMRAFENVASDALRSLRSDTLFDTPKEVLAASAKHLKIDLDTDEINKIVESDLFSHHAKNPQLPFTEAQRKSDQDALLIRFKDQIGDTARWCDEQGLRVTTTLNNSSLL
jgi:hypothetical protein